MKQEPEQKAASFTEARNMLSRGDKVVAGISGGADSICLLFLLCEFRKTLGIDIRVVHVNHGIRKEAGDDAEFVRECCAKWDVPFTLICEDVPKKAAQWGLSEEEAGRRVRYEAFERAADSWQEESGEPDPKKIKIAVAHNMNDNAETVLFRLFRGTGVKGLAGIPAKRSTANGHEIIRPLLKTSREEIEEFLEEKGISWVSDSTNEKDIYSRNRIRLNILPEAEKITSGAGRHICETARMMEETEDLLKSLEAECLEECRIKENPETDVYGSGAAVLDISGLKKYHTAIVKRVILRCLSEIAGGGRDIGSLQTDQIIDLINKEGNRKIDLARGVTACREYDRIVISAKNADDSVEEDFYITGSLETELFELSDILSDNPGFIENLHRESDANKYTKWIDYDKIDGQIEVRTRAAGDHFLTKKPDGLYGRKTLKEYMIDCKIPAGIRDSIPVIAAGTKCIWLVGYRLSDDVKITEKTVKVMKLEWKSESGAPTEKR